MRRCLCTLLLSCVLGFGSLTAAEGDISAAQAQQLVSIAQKSQAGTPVKVTFQIDGKNVDFTLVRSALGEITVTPVAGPDSAALAIGSITIVTRVDSAGLLVPQSLVVVGSDKIATRTYSITFENGAITKLSGPGTGGTGDASKNTGPVGGIGGASGSLKKNDDQLKDDVFPSFKSGNFALAPGTAPGTSNGPASPSTP
jgi:hypothetical protein